MDRHLLQWLQEGATAISNLLLKKYKQMSLSDEEMMLIIHIMSFQQEGIRFPTIEQLAERLSMSGTRLIQLLQKLIKEEWISIDESIEPQTGLRSESYNLDPLYRRLYQCWKNEQLALKESVSEPPTVPLGGSGARVSLYSHFEQAFGRPLSPLEIETIQLWVEQDRYPDELILTALREAASVGKLYIRYIDRILLEWQRQQIKSVEEARHYSMRFRRHTITRDQRQPL